MLTASITRQPPITFDQEEFVSKKTLFSKTSYHDLGILCCPSLYPCRYHKIHGKVGQEASWNEKDDVPWPFSEDEAGSEVDQEGDQEIEEDAEMGCSDGRGGGYSSDEVSSGEDDGHDNDCPEE